MNGTNMALNSPSNELIVCVWPNKEISNTQKNIKERERNKTNNSNKYEHARQPEKPNRIHWHHLGNEIKSMCACVRASMYECHYFTATILQRCKEIHNYREFVLKTKNCLFNLSFFLFCFCLRKTESAAFVKYWHVKNYLMNVTDKRIIKRANKQTNENNSRINGEWVVGNL